MPLRNPNPVKADPVLPPPAPGPVLAVGWITASGLVIHALAQTLKQIPIARHVTGIDKSGLNLYSDKIFIHYTQKSRHSILWT
jgi:hypothetical protein